MNKISLTYKEHDDESSGTHLHNHWITMELEILLDVEKKISQLQKLLWVAYHHKQDMTRGFTNAPSIGNTFMIELWTTHNWVYHVNLPIPLSPT
jgi:hypothetical protein